MVEAWRKDLTGPDGYTPTPDVYEGAKLLAADVYRRSDTYGGVSTMALDNLGGLGAVDLDPIVVRLLGIGRWRRTKTVG
jgi:hypothetical protein